MKNQGKKIRVFSGTRATGRLHLGNYLGAVKGYLELSKNTSYDCIFMAMDLHTITTPYNSKNLNQATREIIMDYLAAGLDSSKVIITVQSLVPEHSYLAFLLSSVVSVARMRHLPTFKDKVKQYPDNVTMALLNYPILMASDILIYKAELVPVGVDQEPHLEIAREIARKMNSSYGLDLPIVKRFATKGEYVPSIKGEGKMSKSVEGSYINLTDSYEEIYRKLAGVETDSGTGMVVPVKGGVYTLLKLADLFLGKSRKCELEEQYLSIGLRYGDLKKELAKAIYEELLPIQKKRAELEKNIDYVDGVIKKGAIRAREIASKNLSEICKKMGIGQF